MSSFSFTPCESISAALLRAVTSNPDEPALLIKHDNAFISTTWQELAHEVARTCAVLKSLGLVRGDRVVQISENRREWILLDLACHFSGIVHVPLHVTSGATRWIEHISHCDAKLVLVSTSELADKLLAAPSGKDRTMLIVAYNDSFLELPAESEPVDLNSIEPRPDDLATILYTSGTTGSPKGVMLSQRNLAFNAWASAEMYGAADRETKLNILPFSHIYARTCDLYSWLVRGSVLALAESRESVLADLQLVRPTTMNAVPYFYERLHRGLREKGLDQTPGALQHVLGGRVRSCSAGGAPLSLALCEFFTRQGIPLLEGYGLTESSPVITMSTKTDYRAGSCGKPIPGIEVRLADDGELLTRGPHVMQGYYRDLEATRHAIQDGWLHTGDLAEFDDNGFMRIIGRKKEIIVTSTGKKISPTHIENLLAQDPLIAQAFLIGEGRSHLAAIIVPQPDALRAEIVARGIAVASREEAIVHPEVLRLFRQRIEHALASQGRDEQVRRFTLIGRAFSQEEGELTPKLSLCRPAILRNFATEIDDMYSRPESDCHV